MNRGLVLRRRAASSTSRRTGAASPSCRAVTGVYKNMNRGIIALDFQCKVTGGQLTTNDEVTSFRWADEQGIEQLASQAYAVRILDALHANAAPAVRQHDGVRVL
jgi:8-oxo-dGTP diphosphatase